VAKSGHPTFGRIIADARRRAGLNQREAAKLIKKEDGESISFQYLSELENDHRNIPSNHILDEIAHAYKISRNYLYLQAERIPSDFPKANKEQLADEIYQYIRRKLEQSAAA
jgi:transcriptional regulator with XRE-family HTH domain